MRGGTSLCTTPSTRRACQAVGPVQPGFCRQAAGEGDQQRTSLQRPGFGQSAAGACEFEGVAVVGVAQITPLAGSGGPTRQGDGGADGIVNVLLAVVLYVYLDFWALGWYQSQGLPAVGVYRR